MSQPESAPPSRGAIAAAEQDLSDAEFAELDELLAAIPEPLEPLDVVMLDGFLAGVVVQPVLLDAQAWLPYVFDAGGHRWGEAEPSPEQLRARTLILRRHAALNRSIAEYGVFDPFLLEPDADADADADADHEAASEEPPAADVPVPDDLFTATVRPWVAGFEQAAHLLPALAELEDPAVALTLARLFRFLPGEEDGDAHGTRALVARERPIASLDDAVSEIVGCVGELYERTAPLRYQVETVRRAEPKVGRNDPCPCGSGRKFKQCHGSAAAARP
ncbi:MAG: UPF0149 family protein [Caldimonas sp.]